MQDHSQDTLSENAGGKSGRPALAVRLDGTLLLTNTFQESFVSACRNCWYLPFVFPFYLARGLSFTRKKLSELATLNAERLPANEEVLEFLRANTGEYSEIAIATSNHEELAESIAKRFPEITRVIATEDGTNSKDEGQADRLVQLYGKGGFDYIGDKRDDEKVWDKARRAMVVSPGGAKPGWSRRDFHRIFRGPRTVRSLVRLLRPHQWVKNLLIFVPLLAGHAVRDPALLKASVLACMGFSFVASAGYIVNDLLDLDVDRRHAHKNSRPLASGHVSIFQALALCVVVLGAGLAIAWMVNTPFLLITLAYLGLTLLYSLQIKKVVALDCIFLAALYLIRIYAGGLAVEIMPSTWLLGFSMFLFYSLALLKRYAELMASHFEEEASARRGYSPKDAAILAALGLGSGLMATVVLAIYVSEAEVAALYERPQALLLLCPILIYWLSLLWIFGNRGEMGEDPLVFSMRDRGSRWSAFVALIVFLLASGIL